MKLKSEHKDWNDAIVKYLSGSISSSEKAELDDWINSSPENRKSFENNKKLWKHSKNISFFETIDENEDWQRFKKKTGLKQSLDNRIYPFRKDRNFLFRIAAVAVLLISIGILFKFVVYPAPETIYISSGNSIKEVQLPDNSKVILNKNSKIVYPEKFRGNERVVSLFGEGYFEVAKNPRKKFQINIENKAVVEVLGTVFNIDSKENGKQVDLQVVSGKVAFYLPGAEENKILLVKEEKASLRNETIKKDDKSDKNFLSWKTGILTFEDANMQKVIADLEKYYKQKIETENINLENYRFTSVIDNQNIESVLNELKLVLNLDHKINEDVIILYNSD